MLRGRLQPDDWNGSPSGLRCVGAINPEFGPIEKLGDQTLIHQLNSSQADFLVVALGSKKGQAWLHRNNTQLKIPVRAHLGAVVNFQAGTVRRAPDGWQRMGLEWLWRIKEEPYLWRRYAHDAGALFVLIVRNVFPLALRNGWYNRQRSPAAETACDPDNSRRPRRNS